MIVDRRAIREDVAMYKISLINMPFADLWFPSIALTQLKAIVEEQFGESVRVRTLYLNQDIAKYLGVRLYCYISNSLETNMAALGDWFFRDVAFPDVQDNVNPYFQRCFPGEDPATLQKKQLILRKRKGLGALLERLVSQYDLGGEDIVGFTTMFCQSVGSFALARKVKERNPAVITVLGGANCEAPMGPELVKHVEQVDYVFSGPALISFPKFVKSCMAGTLAQEPIRGVFSRKSTGDACGINSIGEELTINHFLPLDYGPFLDTLEKNFSQNEISPVLLFETSRGCWWGQKSHCTFCGLNGGTMAYRAMEPKVAIEQFKSLFRFASKCNIFNGVDNILPKNYISEVLPYLDTPPNVELFYEVKADLSRSDVEVLSKARVKRIQPGIEALSTPTLKLMKKGTTAFQNLTLLKNCLYFGVHPEWNLLIGFPGEPESVFKKYVSDLPLFVHLPPPTASFHVRFDRYSPYFVQAAEYKLDLHPSDFYSFIYPFPQAVLHNIAYYFSDHNYSAAYIASVSAWSAKVAAQVDYWRSRWEGGQKLFPKLIWKDESSGVVYDSRSGEAIEHKLDDHSVALLKHLVIPKRLADIVASFQTFDAAAEVASLQAKGLVFEEDQRYMTLVVEEPQGSDEHIAISLLASESPAQGLLA
jgi:ribosomal peptide maturation radical SAM protein 1